MFHLDPGWNGFQPPIVHLTITLLLIAPFLVLGGVALPPAKGRLFLRLALPLMVLGTAMTFVDVTTGGPAMKAISSTPPFNGALEEHRVLAETTRELFVVLTLGFAALLFVPRLLGHELESRINTLLLAVYLVFYTSGALILVHTAHQGGRLVREIEAKAATTHQLSGEEAPK